MINLSLLGSNGRMGSHVKKLIDEDYRDFVQLVAEYNKADNQGDSIEDLLTSNVVIDFSNPDATNRLVAAALKKQNGLPALVIGTTGFKEEELQQIRELSSLTPIIISANFSTAVSVFLAIIKEFSPILKKFGYSARVSETHHKHKKDAPSGTALSIKKALEPAYPKIEITSTRTGEVIGEHHLYLDGPADGLVLSHVAKDRSVFARGALEVALWLCKDKNSGLYSMQDFLENSA